MRLWLLLVLTLAITGCGGGDDDAGLGPRPEAPAENDPAFEVRHVRGWYLVGNELTEGQDVLTVQVFAPEGTTGVDLWIDDREGERLTLLDDGSFAANVDISELVAGDHDLVLAADGAAQAFAHRSFRRSHPLYVVLTTDWDDPDNSELSLRLQEELHVEHPELLITHFVGPYTFTSPDVDETRRGELVDWVTGMRDTYGDEIGLHIHPYCNFVDEIGTILGDESLAVECRTEPSTVYANGDATGYTVMLAAYTEGEFSRQLEAADVLFTERGLGKPTSFRAGGWTADLSTLAALASNGHVADTSANNWARMEEWEGVQNGVLYEWNRDNWSTIGDTSQPYYPSVDDILETGDEVLPILEVPDNGIMVDYVSGSEMTDIFNANFDGETALLEPRAFSIGYHPSNFVDSYKAQIGFALRHADSFLASAGRGPVVYARLSDLAKVWPVP